jgi:hypothetical protein
LDRDIRESEQRYKEKILVQISKTSSPDSTKSETSPPPPEASLVVINEGEHICVLKAKHDPVFGIVAENVTDDMSHAAVIMLFPERGRPPIFQKIKLGKLQKAVERMTLNVYKALCPSGTLDALLASEQRDAAALLGKIAKCHMGGTKDAEDGKVSVEPSATEPPPTFLNFTADEDLGDVTTALHPHLHPDTPTDADLDILIDHGTFVCFQKRNKPTTCGVLVHDVTADNHSGTCLMMDMTYEGLGYDTFPLRTLEKGVKEFTRFSYYKQVLVMNHLKEYLLKERADEEAMNQCVADSMRSYEKRARKSVGPSLNKPAAADGIRSSGHQNPMISVTEDAIMNAQGSRSVLNDPAHNNPAGGATRESPTHQEPQTHVQRTVSNTNDPATKNAPVEAAVASPKHVNPVAELLLGGTTSAGAYSFDNSHGDEERNPSVDDGCGDTSESDGLSENESSKRIRLNLPQKHTQAQRGQGARVHNQSTSKMATSGGSDTKGSVVHAATVEELTRENERLKKMIIGIGNVPATGSQNPNSSKRSKVPTSTLPAGEVARCGLLSLPQEIIEVTSDDEANLFEQEVVAGPLTKQPSRGRVFKKMRSLSPENDGHTTRETLRASQGRIKKKRDGALRNWQDAKSRNCTPHKIYMKTYWRLRPKTCLRYSKTYAS